MFCNDYQLQNYLVSGYKIIPLMSTRFFCIDSEGRSTVGKTYPKVVELLNSEVPDKISRNEFCRRTGINVNSFDRYKAGISEPTQATLQKLSDYFGVSVAVLRGDTVLPIAMDANENNRALTLAAGNLDYFNQNKRTILKKEIRYIYRDIALLVLSLPEGYYDDEVLKRCKESAKNILSEIYEAEKARKQ